MPKIKPSELEQRRRMVKACITSKRILKRRDERMERSMAQIETVEQLTDAQAIAAHVFRMLLSSTQYPHFADSGVPVSVAAKVFGKDAAWVQAGIICGWLPIGKATQEMREVTSLEQIGGGKRTNYYISPKLLWELTGFVWGGRCGREKGDCERIKGECSHSGICKERKRHTECDNR